MQTRGEMDTILGAHTSLAAHCWPEVQQTSPQEKRGGFQQFGQAEGCQHRESLIDIVHVPLESRVAAAAQAVIIRNTNDMNCLFNMTEDKKLMSESAGDGSLLYP